MLRMAAGAAWHGGARRAALLHTAAVVAHFLAAKRVRHKRRSLSRL